MAKHDMAEQLEAMVDSSSLLHVLTALEMICGEKAEHIRANWQDAKTAAQWDKASRMIGALLRKEPIVTNL